jgi:hypothetical protein
MSNPQRFINRVIVFLILVCVVVGVLSQVIWGAFLHNPALNGLIICVLVIGIAYTLRRMLLLKPEMRWIEAFRTSGAGFSIQEPPRLIAPIAAVLGERDRRGRTSLSAVSMRYLLDSISARLDESRDIARYLTGLLIFLGLLGTFWGLLQSINAVGGVLTGFSATSSDALSLFNEMRAGLARPLAGMGTAFSASLFGLAGSLVLGFLDLQATQGQNSFYNDLEEWLSGMTRLSVADSPPAELGVGPSLPVYVQAMLQQAAESLDRLQTVVARGEDQRVQLNKVLHQLNDRLATLTERMGSEQELIGRLADGQSTLVDQLARRDGTPLPDEATRQHLRSIDAQLGQVLDEMGRGRDELVRELRGEIKLVTRTIAIAAGEPQLVRE